MLGTAAAIGDSAARSLISSSALRNALTQFTIVPSAPRTGRRRAQPAVGAARIARAQRPFDAGLLVARVPGRDEGRDVVRMDQRQQPALVQLGDRYAAPARPLLADLQHRAGRGSER